MTNLKTYILILFLSVFTINANAQDEQAEKMLEWANQGTVTNKSYNSEIPFRYIDGYIFVDIIQNDKRYNFLFDTGAEATVIDKSIINAFQYKSSATTTLSGPLFTTEEVKTITLSSIYISDVEFVDTGAISIDMKFAKTMFCDQVDGMIGSNLLKKAKWQIDYEKKVIHFSNDISNLITQEPKYTLKTNLPAKGYGTETVELNIDGNVSQFNFDTGNGREKIVLSPSNLSNFITKNKNVILEYGFSKSALDYKLLAKSVTIGDLKLNNQTINFQREVKKEQLLGNLFFENFLVTVDWEKHQLFLEPTKNVGSDTFVGFELNFKPNFETNKIEIATGLRTFTKKNKIRNGAFLLKVNETDVSNFSYEEFCEFWNLEWSKIKDTEILNLIISQNGKSNEIVVTKKKLI